MDQEIKQEFNSLKDFLRENMVTKAEFSELSARVAKLEESVNRLIDAVEKLTTAVNNIAQEHTVMKHQLMVLQDWARKVSEKIGVEFKL